MSTQPLVVFITATDTGVGKTVLTGLLLEWLQRSNSRVLAWKPFSSGGREDAEFFRTLMLKGARDGEELTLDQINPFAFRAPITPLLAARQEGVRVNLSDVSKQLQGFAGRADILLVEGAGGLLSPLGEGFSAIELIREWQCSVLVVAPNRLGVINHLRLTIGALKASGISRIAVALTEPMVPDDSSEGNADLLREYFPQLPLVTIPHLTDGPVSPDLVEQSVALLDSQMKGLTGALLDRA